MGGQGTLTGQRLLKVLETAEKLFTPSYVSKVQVINTFHYIYIKNSLIYTYISKIVKERTEKTVCHGLGMIFSIPLWNWTAFFF